MSCTAQCIGHNACKVHGCDSTHRGGCTSNRPVSIPNVANGHIIRASDIEALRVNTINEINRWNQHVNYNFAKRSNSSFVEGEIIQASKTDNLINDLSGTGHGTTSNVSVGSVIYANKLASNMLGLYNSLRTDCICNSYQHTYQTCSCNSNYCSNCNAY